jgi:hypothetical protein
MVGISGGADCAVAVLLSVGAGVGDGLRGGDDDAGEGATAGA